MSTWVLAGVILTGAWTQLDEIGWAAMLPLAIVVALDCYRPHVQFELRRPTFQATAPVVVATAICGLHLAHSLLTAREEFGFGGDEGYHLSAMRAFALYYIRAGPFLAVALAVFAAARWQRRRYAASAAMAILIGSSFLLPASPLFGRYPAGFYHLATPLNVAFEAARIPYPFTPAHLINALSVPAWLFVLRPLIIGRWPDWQVVPVVLLLYFQAPALTYLSSTLIEPWAMVFLLLALEALVVLPDDDRWLAVLLGSVATSFKETAIFLMPTIWLVACVKWQRYRPSLRRYAIATGVAAAIPFIVYYFVRLDAHVHRTVTVATTDVLTETRLIEWFTNVRAALGSSALISVVLLFAATLHHLIWTVTAIAVAVFLLMDTFSIPWTGYSRFLALSLVAMAGAVFATTHRVADRRVLVALSSIMIALQAFPVARIFRLDFRPDHERNSLQWSDSLIRLPIRTLIEHLPAAHGASPRRVRVVTSATDLTSLRVAYPDLAERYELVRDDGSADTSRCACRDDAEAVLAAFEWPAHYGDRPHLRSAYEQFSSSCLRQLQASCRAHEVARDRGGAPVGAIGAGVR